MARKRTTKSVKTNQKPPLFPPAVTDFVKSRLKEGMALGLVLVSIGMFISLMTYASTDPSFNTSGQPQDALNNGVGITGAYFSDLFLQTLGFAAYLIPIAFCAWGYRLVRKRPMKKLWARLIWAMVAILFCATALAQIPLDWALGPYMGGIIGGVMLNTVAGWLHGFIGPAARLTATGLCMLITAFALVKSLGFEREEWRTGIARFFNTLGWSAERASGIFSFLRPAKAGTRSEPTLHNEKKIRPKKRILTSRSKTSTTKITPKAAPLKSSKRLEREKQPALSFIEESDYVFPPLDLLQKTNNKKRNVMSEGALQKNAELLQNVLEDFGIHGEITRVNPGPVVTLYELEPAPGLKSSRVISLADDIARSMSAVSVRVAVVPGKNVIGIELPNQKREIVLLRELLASQVYETTKTQLGIVLGKEIGGEPIIADLAKMPHLLVAGTTGSGKSVGVNAMILSILYRMTPEQCRLIMIDPKMLELSVYDDIPHLLTPVVTDPKKAIVALKWAVREMEDRYRSMSKLAVRNIEGYNARIRKARKDGEILTRKVQTGFDPDTGKPVFEEQAIPMTELPYIVVVVDEFADLMLVAGKDVEAAIQRLAQMARAAGIHMIMATQRPSVDVITGTIKANFPSRISFQVTSRIDSRTILGDSGAEHLLGKGDMLYMAGGGRVTRVHGPLVTDTEVESVVKHLKTLGRPQYIEDVIDENAAGGEGGMADILFGGKNKGSDELYDQAVALVASEQKASTSFIQRHLSIGYNRAAKIVEQMEKEGVISSANHVGKRDVLVQQRDYG